MSEIFNGKHLLLDIDVSSQKEALEEIAKLAKALGITNNHEELVNDLIKREEISTTGMENGVAIPHAMSADFIKPAIIVTRFKQGIDWKAIDNKPIKVAFALLIPEKDRSTLHMQYLQNIALALLNPQFNELILNSNNKEEIIDAIANAVERKPEEQKTDDKPINTNNTKGLIIGVTACATGIAHTFMAREAIEKQAKNVGYDIWIETQGQSGAEHKLTDELIKNANYVIIAADISVDATRFVGKKVYQTDTNEAINKPIEVINKAIASTNIVQPQTNATTFSSQRKNKILTHLMSGVSRMLPFVVFSGILTGILSAIIHGVYGNGNAPVGSVLNIMNTIFSIGFTLFVAVFGAFVGESIAGRAAFAPAFIGTFAASAVIRPDANGKLHTMYWFWNNVIPDHLNITIDGKLSTISDISLGIFAAIGMGFAAGYLVKYFNSIKIKYVWRQAWSILFIPVVGTLILLSIFFVLSGPLGFLMNGLAWSLAKGGAITGVNILIGFILGSMIGFDMGGPINKIAFATAITFIPVDPRLMGSVSAAIPIAPFGVGLASVVFGRKLFDEEDKMNGISALPLSIMGISEGAIPFAVKYPKQTIIANIIGSAIAGGLAFLFQVGSHVAAGGLIVALVLGVYADPGLIHSNIPDIFGGRDPGSLLSYISIIWYILAIVMGTIIHCLIYIILIRTRNKDVSTNSSKIKLKIS